MAEPQNMIVPLLQEMRAEISGRFDRVDKRFDRFESAQISFKHALSADSFFSKLIVGEFDERIEALEQHIKELEAAR